MDDIDEKWLELIQGCLDDENNKDNNDGIFEEFTVINTRRN